LHQRENVLKKMGINRDLGKVFLRMSHARSKKEMNYLIRTAKAIAEQDVKILASGNFTKMLKNC